jgi:hypothetical protein
VWAEVGVRAGTGGRGRQRDVEGGSGGEGGGEGGAQQAVAPPRSPTLLQQKMLRKVKGNRPFEGVLGGVGKGKTLGRGAEGGTGRDEPSGIKCGMVDFSPF